MEDLRANKYEPEVSDGEKPVAYASGSYSLRMAGIGADRVLLVQQDSSAGPRNLQHERFLQTVGGKAVDQAFGCRYYGMIQITQIQKEIQEIQEGFSITVVVGTKAGKKQLDTAPGGL